MKRVSTLALGPSASEVHAHFARLTPSDVDSMSLIPSSDDQSEDVGNADYAGNFEPRSESRSIADRAIDGSATIEHDLPGSRTRRRGSDLRSSIFGALRSKAATITEKVYQS
jgi:hypothetical protein